MVVCVKEVGRFKKGHESIHLILKNTSFIFFNVIKSDIFIKHFKERNMEQAG